MIIELFFVLELILHSFYETNLNGGSSRSLFAQSYPSLLGDIIGCSVWVKRYRWSWAHRPGAAHGEGRRWCDAVSLQIAFFPADKVQCMVEYCTSGSHVAQGGAQQKKGAEENNSSDTLLW